MQTDKLSSALKDKEQVARKGFLERIGVNGKAGKNMQVPRNASLVEKSALQYFEDCFIA